MNNKNITCIAIAPIYDIQTIWFEQLLDYLLVNQDTLVLFPKIQQQDAKEIEINTVIPLLQQIVSKKLYYRGSITEQSIYSEAYKSDYTYAIDKIISYIQPKNNQLIDLDELNSEVSLILAHQYYGLIPELKQQEFTDLTDQFSADIQKIVTKNSETDYIIIVPLEYAHTVYVNLIAYNNLEIERYTKYKEKYKE